MKLTKRKGFNFFRSYYDVYNELNDKDKVQFMDALLDRQFLGVKPHDLKGMAKFAYISQTNSIDTQIKGYEDKTGNKLQGGIEPPTVPPTVPPTQGGLNTPTQQVQVQEKGKEQVQEKEQLTLISTPTKVEARAFTDEVEFVYDSVLPMFPNTHKPKNEKQSESWKDCIDKLIRIDKVDAQSIIHITKEVRADKFWNKNFLTIKKLREKKDGVARVFDFIERFKKPIKPANFGTADSFKMEVNFD